MPVNDKIKLYKSLQYKFDTYPQSELGNMVLNSRYIVELLLKHFNFSRIGIWLLNNEHDKLQEQITLGAGHNSSKKFFELKSFPLFIHELLLENDFVIDQNNSKQSFKEFISHYLIPQGLYSVSIFPIHHNSKIVGAIFGESNEQTIELDDLDKIFLGVAANFVSRCLSMRDLSEVTNSEVKKTIDINRTNAQLDLAMVGAKLAMWDYNIVTGIQRVNDQWFERLGYEKKNEGFSELSSWSELIHPEDKLNVMFKVDQLLTGQTSTYEARYRIKQNDGEYQWVLDRGQIVNYSSDGKPLRAIGVNIDISPLIHLQESFKDSVNQFKLMIESLPLPLMMIDHDLNILAYTGEWESQWRSHHSLSIGNSIFEDASFPNIPMWTERFHRALKGEVLEAKEEFVQMDQTGGFWLRWIITPWYTSKSSIGGIIIFVDNISNKKEAEIKLYQNSKLSSLGEMAGGIAHEINNPLGIIKGYIETLTRQIDRDSWTTDQSKSYLNKMDQTVQRISKIVAGMKRFARDGSNDKSIEYSMNQIIEETLDICSEKIKNSGIEFNVKYLTEDLNIRCRPIEISQVLLNLINNSLHEIPNHDFPWLHIECSSNETSIFIKVIDSGTGIPDKVKDRLFQPFFTTKDVGIGTGLGLSISKGIIDSHRGQLSLDEKSANTCFIIELPRSL